MLRIYHASALPLLGRKDGTNLSRYRREKLARTTAPRAYAEDLGAELLLLAALRDLGLPVKEPLEIICGEGGKPALTGGPEFSLSHSGGRVLCALSDRPVGADLQQLRPYNPALAHRFFTAEEAAWLEVQREEELAFTLLWSLKESYVKFLGSGIARVHLDSFTVRMAGNGLAQIPDSGVKLWYTVRDGYVMSFCSDSEDVPEVVKEIALS